MRSVPLPPGTAVRPVEPSRALVPPLEGVETTSTGQDAPLGRSGVSVLDLLLTSDLVVERDAVVPAALEMGLEAARGALLRQQPGEALEALDAVWPRAAQSEEGWYLRAGALVLLGQPEESDRIATEGLERAPQSVALRFLQSVARAVGGDLAGARAAIAATLDAAPGHPVLVAQQLVLQTRQGRGRESDTLLERLVAAFPDHPATMWAQREVRAIRADLTRAVSRATPTPTPTPTSTPAASPSATPSGATEATRVFTPRSTPTTPPRSTPTMPPPSAPTVTPRSNRAESAPPAPSSLDELRGMTDATAPTIDDASGEGAFSRLGVRLAVAGTSDALDATRTLLRSFSQGGALAGGVLPDQAHAARTVLAAMVSALRREPVTPGASPTVLVIRQVVQALRDGRGAELPRLLQREARAVPWPQRRWIDALLREVVPNGGRTSEAPRASSGERATDIPRATPRATATEETTVAHYDTVVHDIRPDGPEVPVRLGLGLLVDSTAARQSALTDVGRIDLTTGIVTPADGRAVASVAGVQYTPGPSAPLDMGTILPPILALAVALAAGINGATTLAVVALAATVWLALRRRTIALEPAPRPDRDTPQGTAALAERDGASGID